MLAKYIFKLYVNGDSPRSQTAIANSKKICALAAGKDHRLTIKDLNSESIPSEEDNILAVPLLIREHPLPSVRFIGDFSETDEIAELFAAE